MSRKQVKGLIVGYPLNKEGQPMRHCDFILEWLNAFAAAGAPLKVPVTLVNEYNTSMEAKVQIADQVNKQLTSIMNNSSRNQAQLEVKSQIESSEKT